MDKLFEIEGRLGQISAALEGINGRGGFVKLNDSLESISESLSNIADTLKSIDSLGVSVTVVNDKTRIPITVAFCQKVEIDSEDNPVRIEYRTDDLHQ